MSRSENRWSSYSNSINPRIAPTQSSQVSTQTLLNALHNSYSTAKPYVLDAGTSLVVNTWITAGTEGADGRQGGTVDGELARRAWEHARRRAEDGCIVLGTLHESTPSLFAPFISSMPLSVPDIFYTALSAILPFVTCVTPQNPSKPRYSSFAATLLLGASGSLNGITLKLSTSGIDTSKGLLNVPSEVGYRAFDVFYYLLSTGSTSAEREFLGLKSPSSYALLNKSGTYDPPSFLPTADDEASAEAFRAALKAIGISGATRRDLVSVVAAILKLGDTLGFLVEEEELESTCEEVAELLGVDPEAIQKKCSSSEREIVIAGIYEAVVDWVISKANAAIASEMSFGKNPDLSSDSGSRAGALTPITAEDDEDTVSMTVIDIQDPVLGKAISLKTIFDDSEGINAEMKEDGVSVTPAGHSVIGEMNAAVKACEPDLGIKSGPAGRERELELDRRERALDKIGQEAEYEGFLKKLLYPINGDGIGLGRANRFELTNVIGSCRAWFHLCLHPTDELPAKLAANAAAWSAGSPSRQLRSWRLPEWANRRNRHLDFSADFDMEEFCNRYSRLGCKEGKDGIESFILERGWSNGEVIIGNERVWIREGAWWEAESMLDMLPAGGPGSVMGESFLTGQHADNASGYFATPFGDNATIGRDSMLQRNQSSATLGNRSQLGAKSLAPTAPITVRSIAGGDYGLGTKGDEKRDADVFLTELDPELADAKVVTEQPVSALRRFWVGLTYALTFWIPSFMLRTIGRMKRPDVRMAWREKFVLVFLIFLLNASVIFVIIVFGRLLCPNFDKAWNREEVHYHQGENDFYVSVRGSVYDISKFWQIDHSNIVQKSVTSQDMLPLAGKDVTYMFPLPLYAACPRIFHGTENDLLMTNDTTVNSNVLHGFRHLSGALNAFQGSSLTNPNWYNRTFLPRMKKYYKGALVTSEDVVRTSGFDSSRMLITMGQDIYDLTDYFYTLDLMDNFPTYKFLDPAFEQHIQSNPGSDMTNWFNSWVKRNQTAAYNNLECIDNLFYAGKLDFRESPRCIVNNYILLAFTIILCTVILVKFLAALQLGSKRRPAAQDKFVICQVPAYTEGEDQLRKGLDSLTALAYDNKRKLICVICDGMIVGGGNDRPTPKIVLDILGVDPKIDPPALPFKSVGAGSEQLNYGKVYSGLYEYEGNVVPYVVVVKVGKESEQTKSKPGNRGKRDSQILLMSFLNRVHHRSSMNPLELEMFHQINNIIGVDPELYEYLFMVDADTMVKEDALNRLVSSCANDAKIAGICGETSLENEERSWWTMIQVYEYYISHHLTKAFESLFGSVTCLPGCFCMYRLRTADRGKPLIISDKVIQEYSDCEVDTLHKKNLLALGEDRYLTTLMTKHFPSMSYKFVPNALALTAAPETWSILLSQRRRWINSTIHNLLELMFLKDLCGFCCFSMRFVVFIDLFGTLILPATCAYIGYLIYKVASHSGSFPIFSIVMIGAVYGLQAVIFIIKRQWQHIGWMIIYLIAFPVYSFLLPLYAFWKQDDFSWGSTRIVIGEKGQKQVVAIEDEKFDPRSIPLQRWDDYAAANNLPGRRGIPLGSEKNYGGYDDGYEMDDMRSVYSSVKPASSIITGLRSHGGLPYIPPQSPAQFTGHPSMQQRQSGMSNYTGPYTENPQSMMQDPGSRLMSLGNMSDQAFNQYHHSMQSQRHSPYPMSPSQGFPSQDNLLSQTPPLNRAGTRSPFSGHQSNPPPAPIDFVSLGNGPSEAQIQEAVQACLSVVDLDTVNKKGLRQLVEQRLQHQLSTEKRAYLDRCIDWELANM